MIGIALLFGGHNEPLHVFCVAVRIGFVESFTPSRDPGFARIKMTLASPAVFDFSGRGNLKPLRE